MQLGMAWRLVLVSLVLLSWVEHASTSTVTARSLVNAQQAKRALRGVPRRQQLSLTQAEEKRVEALEAAEREALTAQQVALEALTAQQSALAAQQDALKRQQTELASHITSIHKQDPSFGANFDKETVIEKAIGASVYIGMLCIAAVFYNVLHMSDPPDPKTMPPENKRDFQFGLFDGFRCDPDPRICMCSCFCTPIRWADTASDFRVHFMDFWPGLLLFALLQVAGSFTFGLSLLVLLLVQVQNRQRMRHNYNMPRGSCDSVIWDCAVWAFCGPCATMQEALQVEYVEPPLPETMHGFRKF